MSETGNDRWAFCLAQKKGRLHRTGWFSGPKGFSLAKFHPKAQEVHSLIPRQADTIPWDSHRPGNDCHPAVGGGKGGNDPREEDEDNRCRLLPSATHFPRLDAFRNSHEQRLHPQSSDPWVTSAFRVIPEVSGSQSPGGSLACCLSPLLKGCG